MFKYNKYRKLPLIIRNFMGRYIRKQMDPLQLARRIVHNMHLSTRARNHKRLRRGLPKHAHPIFDNSQAGARLFLQFVCNQGLVLRIDKHKVLPLSLISGRYNTVSPDRIDENRGYVKDNIRLYPAALNTPISASPHDLASLSKWRHRPCYNYINDLFCNSPARRMFHRMIRNAKGSCKRRGRIKRHLKCHIVFQDLVNLYISQGGRCAITQVPLLLKSHGGWRQASLDRIDSTQGYNNINCQLTCLSFNAALSGQHWNPQANLEERQLSCVAASINIEWLRLGLQFKDISNMITQDRNRLTSSYVNLCKPCN